MKTATLTSFARANIAVLAIALFGIVLHLVFINGLGFHRDELLYFSLGQHPAMGYHSTPPLIGLLSWMLNHTLGFTPFAARIIPALLFGVLIGLSSAIAGELGGGKFAKILTALSILCNLTFLRGFSMLMPVPFDIFFWTLALYLFLRFVNTSRPAPLLWFFAVLGLGFLNKYNIVFLALPIGIFILSTNYRKLLSDKYLYIGIGLALLVILPNLIWQVAHGLPVLRHMRELKESQLNNMSAATFLPEQLLMLFPATIIAIPGLIFLIGSKAMKQYRFFGIILVVIILLYLLLRGKSYYTAGIYPFLIAAGSLFFESWLRKPVPRAIVMAAILFGGFLILPMGLPVFPPDGLVTYFNGVQKSTGNNSARRFEDNSHHPLPQDYADMLGWDELTRAVQKAWQKVENKESCIIFADNYGEASAITILGKKFGLPEAISFNDAYRYWAPSSFPGEITEVIYINFRMGEDVGQLFGTVEETGGITNPLSREYGLKVFHCSRPLKSFNAFWAEVIKTER